MNSFPSVKKVKKNFAPIHLFRFFGSLSIPSCLYNGFLLFMKRLFAVQDIQDTIKYLPGLLVMEDAHVGCVKAISPIGGKLYFMFQLALQRNGTVAALARFIAEKKMKRNFPDGRSLIEVVQKRTVRSRVAPGGDNGRSVLNGFSG